MRSSTRRYTALVLALIAVLALPAMAAGSVSTGESDVDRSIAGDGPIESTAFQSNDSPSSSSVDSSPSEQDDSSTTRTTSDTDDVKISESLQQADGTVSVVVRMDEPDRVALATSDDPVADMAAHAEVSQQPLLEFATDTPGVAVENRFWLTNAVVLEVDTGHVSVDELARLEGVEEIHENYQLSIPEPAAGSYSEDIDDLEPTAEPAGTNGNTTYGVDAVNAPAVWDAYETRGDGTRVAVLDTGVDPHHPDIDLYTDDPQDPTYPGGWAYFDVTGEHLEDVEPHDTHIHGTHVSGTVAGGNASGQYIGVAPDTELLHGMVLEEGTGSFAQIIAGMEWAVEQDADVISMSLGAPGQHAAFIDPIRNAEDAGVLVVAATGNSGPGVSGSPGNVYDALGVGATDENHDVAPFSSGERIDTAEAWGSDAPEDWPEEYLVPDVSAPGVNVSSAFPGGAYYELDGTSMATPHVSGVAALALSATNGSTSPDAFTSTVSDTAWKPANETPEQDARYGHGIVDAKDTIDLLTSDAVLTGTVVDAEADDLIEGWIPGATVSVEDEFETETDFAGSYALPLTEGTYNVTADATGYAPNTTTVTIGDDTEVQHFELDRTVEVETLEADEAATRPGQLNVTFRGWNHETITVDRAADEPGDVSAYYVTPDGDWTALEWGETHAFPEEVTEAGYPHNITIVFDFEEHLGFGTQSEEELPPMNVTIGGPGENVTKSYSYEFFDELTSVGVVSDPAVDDSVFNDPLVRDLGDELAATIENQSPRYQVEVIRGPTEAAQRADEFDVFVVQDLPTDDEAILEFIDETEATETGVIYLESHGGFSNAISALSAATGNPGSVGSQSPYGDLRPGHDTNDAFVAPLEEEHPILQGVEPHSDDPDGFAKIRTAGYVSWAESYHGGEHVAASAFNLCDMDGCDNITIEDPETEHLDDPVGIAVNDLTRTVLANSLGEDLWASPYTDNRGIILANAIDWAAEYDEDRLMPRIIQGQPTTVEPGEQIEVGVTNVGAITIDLADDHSTVSTDDLDLFIKDYATGDTFPWEFGDQYEGMGGTIGIAVQTDDVDYGVVSLDLEAEESGTEPVSTSSEEVHTGGTGPTTIYEGDQIVLSEGEDIQEAIDAVRPGDEVVLEDGHWTADSHITVPANKEGVTVRAAEGANPTIEFPYKEPGRLPAFDVEADDVTVEGITVDLGNQTYNRAIGVTPQNGNDDLAPRGVTFRNVTAIGGWAALYVGASSGSPGGDYAQDVLVEDSHFEGLGHGAQIGSATNVTVRNSTFEDVWNDGVSVGGQTEDVTIENNVVVNASQGITTSTGDKNVQLIGNEIRGGDNTAGSGNNAGLWLVNTDVVVDDNDLSGVDVGVVVIEPMAELPRSQSLTNNVIEADVGVEVRLSSSTERTTTLRYNDLSETDVGVYAYNEPADADPLDARLNYFGPNGPAEEPISFGSTTSDSTTVAADAAGSPSNVGPVQLHPFATAPPSADPSIGLSFQLEAGEAYALGIPAPTEQTVGDVFGDGEGAVYGFDPATQEWVQLTAEDEVDGLDALLVVAETDTTATIAFGVETDAQPVPQQRELLEGWNFVPAPKYGGADEVFGTSSADVSIVLSSFAQPRGQLGDGGSLDGDHLVGGGAAESPTVSPFTGYFVFAQEDGKLPATVGSNPTIDEFYDGLDIPREHRNDGGDGISPATAAEIDNAVNYVTAGAPADRWDVIGEATRAALLDDVADVPEESQSDVITVAERALLESLPSIAALEDEEVAERIVQIVEESTAIVIEEASDESGDGWTASVDRAGDVPITPAAHG